MLKIHTPLTDVTLCLTQWWNYHLRCQVHLTLQVCNKEETYFLSVTLVQRISTAMSPNISSFPRTAVSAVCHLCSVRKGSYVSSTRPTAGRSSWWSCCHNPCLCICSVLSHLCISYQWDTPGSAKRPLVIRLRRRSKEKWSACPRHTLGWQFSSYEWLKLLRSSMTAVR